MTWAWRVANRQLINHNQRMWKKHEEANRNESYSFWGKLVKGKHAMKLGIPLAQLLGMELLVFLFVCLCTWAFRLKLGYGLGLLAFSLLYLIRILKKHEAYLIERKRFEDINSYMQQLSSALLVKKRILPALREVEYTFQEGRMQELLAGMIETIAEALDVREGEKKALKLLEAEYGNRHLTLLHDFARRVEKRGGAFEEELELIAKNRRRWVKRIEEYQTSMKLALTGAVVLYLALIFICAFVNNTMPESVCILYEPLVQKMELLMVLLFFLMISFLQKKQKDGYFQGDAELTEEKANRLYQRYMEARALGAMWYRFQMKREIKRAFPQWLFDVCLLMQKNNITVSISESSHSAPYILKPYIYGLLEELKHNPASVECYLRFLEEFKLPGIKATMHMLIAMNRGMAGDAKGQMQQLIAHNMNLLDESEREYHSYQYAALTRFYFYPMIPATGLLMLYCVEIIRKVFALMGGII